MLPRSWYLRVHLRAKNEAFLRRRLDTAIDRRMEPVGRDVDEIARLDIVAMLKIVSGPHSRASPLII